MRSSSWAATVIAVAALASVGCPAPTTPPSTDRPPPGPATPVAPPSTPAAPLAMPDATRTADVLTAEGIALGRRGDLRDALVWFDAALAKDPKHVGARYNQGVTFLSLDRPLEAERAFLAFVELRPDDVSAHIAIARIQGSTGRPDAALASLQRAVKGGFDDPATLKDSAFSDLKRDLRFLALEATVAQRAAAAGRPVADEDFARIGADLNYGGTSVPGLKLPGIRNAGECKQQADGSLSCTPEPDAP